MHRVKDFCLIHPTKGNSANKKPSFSTMSSFIPFYFTATNGSSSITSFTNLLENQTFKSLQMPKFECANYTGFEIRDLSSLNITSKTNKARAGGVDTNNIEGLKGEFSRGYRPEKFPPVLMIFPDGSEELWDGYNRYAALNSMGIENFLFAVYYLKPEWMGDRLEDAYDEVSLGFNNHAQCKPSTVNDFVVRGTAWARRQLREVTKNDIVSWVNSISQSWTKKQVESISRQVYQATTVSANITPYTHSNDAKAWVNKNVDTEVNPLIICTKERGYILRAIQQVMSNYVTDSIDTTPTVLYTKGCESPAQVDSQREFAIKFLTHVDNLIMSYAEKRQSNPDSMPFEIIGALPQLIGVEDFDSLVKIDVESIMTNVEEKV